MTPFSGVEHEDLTKSIWHHTLCPKMGDFYLFYLELLINKTYQANLETSVQET